MALAFENELGASLAPGGGIVLLSMTISPRLYPIVGLHYFREIYFQIPCVVAIYEESVVVATSKKWLTRNTTWKNTTRPQELVMRRENASSNICICNSFPVTLSGNSWDLLWVSHLFFWNQFIKISKSTSIQTHPLPHKGELSRESFNTEEYESKPTPKNQASAYKKVKYQMVQLFKEKVMSKHSSKSVNPWMSWTNIEIKSLFSIYSPHS